MHIFKTAHLERFVRDCEEVVDVAEATAAATSPPSRLIAFESGVPRPPPCWAALMARLGHQPARSPVSFSPTNSPAVIAL